MQKHKLRTFLTAFGVFWGIFMLVLLLGAGKGLENGVYTNFADMATNSVVVWGERTSMPYKGLKPGRHIMLNNEDTKLIKSSIPEVEHVAPHLNLFGNFVVANGSKNGSFDIRGETPELCYVEKVNITAGRFVNQKDENEKRKVAIIGERAKSVLFAADENPIGKYISIKGAFFKIVGVFKPKKGGRR